MNGQYTSIKAVIGKVIGKLRLTDVSSTISMMADWAVDAEMKIGSRNSYERVECELTVENYRACLPMGFVKMIGVKKGAAMLEVTMKDFRQFHKSLAVPVVDDKKFNAGNLITVNPGQPNVHQVNLVPVFQPGDVINLSITQDSCGDATINSFNYVVQPGDTLPLILAAFVAMINGVPGLPYTAVQDSMFFQVMAINNLVNLQLATNTDSATGGINHQLITRRILPTTRVVKDGEDCPVVITTGSENLANRGAAMLNDGMNAQFPFVDGMDVFGGNANTSKYSLDNGFIHFNAIEEGKVGIAYWGIRLDEEGWPMIYSDHVDAVTQYLMWQFDLADYRMGKVSGQYMQSMERRWYTLCAQARGDDEMPDTQEMIYLANQWNQLLPLPNKNLF
jgi:hypothetical protein